MRTVYDKKIKTELQIDKAMGKCLRRSRNTKIAVEIFSAKGHFIERLNSMRSVETVRGFLKRHFLGDKNLRIVILEG